ncbi:MAG: methyl-accepting chemotaxis protein [Oligoflexales bacterium]
MKISLIKRIILIAIIPCLAFAGIISFIAYQNSQNISNLKLAQKDLVAVEKISHLVSATQTERGYSALFISSGRTLTKKLNELRDTTNGKLADLTSYYEENKESLPRFSAIYQLSDNIKRTRSKVDTSGTKEGIIADYSEIVRSFIALETIDISGIPAAVMSRLRNYIALGETGEAMGLLRARLSSILKNDLPYSNEQFNAILGLKGTVSANFSSNSIKAFPQTFEKLKALENSSQWKKVDNVFQNVIVLSNEGGFGEDGEAFFGTISQAIKNLKGISEEEIIIIKQAITTNTAASQRSLIIMIVTMAVFFLGVGLLIYYLTVKIKQDLLGMLASFESLSNDLLSTSTALNQASKEMNLSSISQSSSIEETAASVEEIAAMTKNNLERARESTESSKTVSNLAEESTSTMTNLINSIEKIEESNQQVQNISKLISGISDKTDMIDEIVLQTKLLSFNASVEAERAGEYGRGFSVVASEVGKLAQISGKSAIEISAIVNEAVKESNSIADVNSKRVTSSSQLVREYSKTLVEILESAKSLNEKSEEVLNASNEQSTGLNQINEAIQQLDQVNQKNKASADETAATSVLIQEKAHNLDNTVMIMRQLLGRDRSAHEENPDVYQNSDLSGTEYKQAS